MLTERLLVTIILLPAGMLAIAAGGIVYAALIAIFMLLAAWEYTQLFRVGGYQPALLLILGGTLLLLAGRYFLGFTGSDWMLAVLVLASMAYHLWQYERGRDQAGTDFAITLSGILYFGWIGGYLISLRALPEGKWWVFLALPAVWLADSGAYFIGRKFGRRQFSARLSPKKTWEGFWGGVVWGTLGAVLLSAAWRIGAGPDSAITPANSALLGLALAVLTPLGDLGESMIKRQFGVKDSSNLIPGHGGFFDRVDSWLWAGVLAYYIIVWFF